MPMHDVIVAGGGPGGLYASTLLAREGFDVVVAEEHRLPGEPVHCTGVLAAAAFGEFDVPRESVLNGLTHATFISPSGRAIRHSTPDVEALVIDRAKFDAGLHLRAIESGVSVRVDARIVSVDVEPGRVVATAQDGSRFAARACVLACGANYLLQRRLNLGLPSVFLRSAQMELPAATAGDVEVHFGRNVAPKGFAWVVPVQRNATHYARVGLMCDHDAAKFFRQFTASVGPKWGLRLGGAKDAAVAPRQKILPLAPIRRTFSDRILAVGDAAGLVKATTGGGIYYSLVSASAAAAVLTDALKRDTLAAASLKQYEKIWRARLGPELRAQLALRMLAQRLDDGDIDGLFELARTNGIMPIVRKTARFNEHRDLILSLFKHPPARRLLFKQLVGRTSAFSLQ